MRNRIIIPILSISIALSLSNATANAATKKNSYSILQKSASLTGTTGKTGKTASLSTTSTISNNKNYLVYACPKSSTTSNCPAAELYTTPYTITKKANVKGYKFTGYDLKTTRCVLENSKPAFYSGTIKNTFTVPKYKKDFRWVKVQLSGNCDGYISYDNPVTAGKIEATPVFKPIEYHLTIEPNEGSIDNYIAKGWKQSGSAYVRKYTIQQDIKNLVSHVGRIGYKLDGFCTDKALKNCTQLDKIDFFDNTLNKKYYVKWKRVYTVHLDANGGKVDDTKHWNQNTSSGLYYSYYNLFDKLELPLPKKSGYTFAGWCMDQTLTRNCKTNVDLTGSQGDKVYYAKWTQPDKNTKASNSDVPSFLAK